MAEHILMFRSNSALLLESSSSWPLYLPLGVEVVYFHLITLRHTPQSGGLLWTRDRPVAETSTWQHVRSQETNIHAPCGIRTRNPSKRSATDPRLRPSGHWDRHCWSPGLFKGVFTTSIPLFILTTVILHNEPHRYGAEDVKLIVCYVNS
jgi:hypothetical protein